VGVSDILAQVDHDLNQLKQARALLVGDGRSIGTKRSVKKRNLTAEGRRRIVEAVKRRWAAERKSHK
jgi:hypothetical protein